MEPVNTSVRVDDPDSAVKVEGAADAVLEAHGWRRTGAYAALSDKAVCAPVERYASVALTVDD